jgi:hypothetical protein
MTGGPAHLAGGVQGGGNPGAHRTLRDVELLSDGGRAQARRPRARWPAPARRRCRPVPAANTSTPTATLTSDSHKGLKAAIDRHFQGASWQRCQVHFARDLVGMVGGGRRRELAEGLREIFAATTREQALTAAEAVAARWVSAHPAVARLLEEGIEDCLACLAFPLAHRPRIRTTNGMERLNEEIKRRTRVVRIFPNAEACLRLVTALCVEQSEEWVSGRRYLGISDMLPGMRKEDALPT